jgi:hypothetical protein
MPALLMPILLRKQFAGNHKKHQSDWRAKTFTPITLGEFACRETKHAAAQAIPAIKHGHGLGRFSWSERYETLTTDVVSEHTQCNHNALTYNNAVMAKYGKPLTFLAEPVPGNRGYRFGEKIPPT